MGSTVQAALALGPISDPTSGTTSLKSLNTSEVHFLFGKIKKIDYQDEVLGFKIILYFTYVYICIYSSSNSGSAFAN